MYKKKVNLIVMMSCHQRSLADYKCLICIDNIFYRAGDIYIYTRVNQAVVKYPSGTLRQ